MSIGFSNELFRECFGNNSNVPMLNQASNICLTTYVTFLQNKLETVVQQQLSDSESKDLLPCPFCGAIPIKNRKEAVFQILCTTCLTEKTAFDFETAIQRWNTRTSNIVQQQLSGSPEGSPKCLNKNCTYYNEMFDMNCDANEDLCEKCLSTSDNGERYTQMQN